MNLFFLRPASQVATRPAHRGPPPASARRMPAPRDTRPARTPSPPFPPALADGSHPAPVPRASWLRPGPAARPCGRNPRHWPAPAPASDKPGRPARGRTSPAIPPRAHWRKARRRSCWHRPHWPARHPPPTGTEALPRQRRHAHRQSGQAAYWRRRSRAAPSAPCAPAPPLRPAGRAGRTSSPPQAAWRRRRYPARACR